MRPDSLFVIGLGPAGGSVAWGAVEGGVGRVVGYDRVRSDAVQALRAGAVHAVADRLEDGLRGAQMVVIASGGVEALQRLAPKLAPDTLVTTLAQVAAPVAAAATSAGLGPRWAASHPARLPVGEGFEDARADAFRGTMVAVTALTPSGDAAGSEVMHFWESVYDARAVRMTVEEHDRRIAWMDQLPALLAAIHGDALSRGSLGGATTGGAAARLAALAPDEGAARALMDNRVALLAALDGASRALDELRRALERGDPAEVAELLLRARGKR
jgi:3-phosphoshikimate 1-carboxyvinyltransferase